MKKIVTYYAEDGKRFHAEEACLKWEEQLRAFRERMEAKIGKYKDGELVIGRGVTRVNELPYEAPWLSPLGVCLITITDIRRGEDGSVEFQLGDEEARPYVSEKTGETHWVKADAFYSEWPQ